MEFRSFSMRSRSADDNWRFAKPATYSTSFCVIFIVYIVSNAFHGYPGQKQDPRLVLRIEVFELRSPAPVWNSNLQNSILVREGLRPVCYGRSTCKRPGEHNCFFRRCVLQHACSERV